MARKSIFSVSSGSYSDYSPGVFFPTSDLAAAYIKQDHPDWTDDDGSWNESHYIEEFYLYDAVPERRMHTTAYVMRDGEGRLSHPYPADMPFENERKVDHNGTTSLSGHAEWVAKVYGEISAERKAKAAGIA